MPTILGGGLSGLAAGYYLARRHVSPLTILEASNRFGGWIRTENHTEKGFIFEQGPRTIRPKGPAAPHTLELIEDLGLEENLQPIYPGHPAATNRMIFANNSLHLLPSSLGGIFRTNTPFSKPLVSGLFHDLVKSRRTKKALDDEPIYDFVARRFGKEIADYAVSSMICGICAGDAKEISVRFLMNDLFEKEQQYGGVLKGIVMDKLFGGKKSNNCEETRSELANRARTEKWSIYSLQGGMEVLPKSIEAFLNRNQVLMKKSSSCSTITFKGSSATIRSNGQDMDTDHVISALPSFRLAAAVEDQHPSLACQLRAIPYVDVAVVNLQYSSPDVLKHNAFGFLVPPLENLSILGVIFDSCCFDMRGNTVLTVMMGGKWFQDHFGDNPSQKDILDNAVMHVRNILKIHSEPKLAKVNILKKCIPQYTVGHKTRVEGIRNYIRKYDLPLSVCGAAYDGVGVNDVILSAKRQIHSIMGC